MYIYVIMLQASSLTRYSASAGSGKTFTLAGIYLDSLFRDQYSYQSILAVTFTNKAAAEMKERILNTLFQLANGEESGYLESIMETTGQDEDRVRRRAASILNTILHDYSRFSVGTIDSFFQKVIRAFVKESGLHSGFNLILDHSVILSESVDSMLLSVEDDRVLMDWLVEYSNYEIMEGNHWNLKRKIVELGEEIFREEYRLLLNDGKIINDKDRIKSVLRELQKMEFTIGDTLKRRASAALSILSEFNVSQEELRGKSNSIMKFLTECLTSVPDKLGSSMQKAWEEGLYWTGKTAPASIERAMQAGLPAAVDGICEFYNDNIKAYRSVQLVKSNLYSLGILTDISSKMRDNLADSNRFLLSDAGDVLRRIIGKDQTPFIYEKIGNRYSIFMIDEFQDTSRIQWDNFYPLIVNSISGGDSSLVVGDVKQAIYRWRNSDWRILSSLHERFDQGMFDSKSLDTNWRSCPRIIEFNNRLFSLLPGIVEEQMGLTPGAVSDLYNEAVQKDPGRLKEGVVRISRVYPEGELHQKEVIMNRLPSLIEEIQDNGYSAGDIGILVRKNDEGQEVINRLMEYEAGASAEKRKRYSYRIISQDSLLLANSPVVKLLVAALNYSVNRGNDIALASMVHNLEVINSEGELLRPTLLNINELVADLDSFLDSIRYLPVFDFIDRLVSRFKLGEYLPGIPFLNTLQDMVLELSTRETADITIFLEWWESEGHKRSVTSPDQHDSIQLMTIHKSKGLQFKVVIVPFLAWKMDHGMAPSIWVYSDEKPFADLGAVPVRYRKEIGDTVFAYYYEKEKRNAAVDKINLLYVALTRAEEALYGFVPTGFRKETGAGSMIFDALEADEELGKALTGSGEGKSESTLFEWGSPPVKATLISEREENPVTIPYKVFTRGAGLTLLRKSKGLIIRSAEGESMINYGLLMHDILARIVSKNELPGVLDDVMKEGIIASNERQELEQKLRQALSGELPSRWFSGSDTYWIERDILLPGGSVRRPDRVVITDEGATVIDFKFGAEHPSHIRQVQDYSGIVARMTGGPAGGYVWYVDSGSIIEV